MVYSHTLHFPCIIDFAKYSKLSDTKELFAKEMRALDNLLIQYAQVASFDSKNEKW